jgi:hypothetical protein
MVEQKKNCRESLHDSIIGKIILLKIEGKRMFFRIMRVHEERHYNIVGVCETSEWDARMCGIVHERAHFFRVFDFRKNNGHKGVDVPARFVRVSIEGYGAIFDIGILFRDVTEIVGIAR